MTPLQHLALDEFNRRKASIDNAVNAGQYPRQRGEQILAKWLAIALMTGIAPRQIDALREHWQAERKLSDCFARTIVLEQCPPRAECLAELARARDTAAAKARANPTNRALNDRHCTLQCLAIHLGAPADRQVEEEREAA